MKACLQLSAYGLNQMDTLFFKAVLRLANHQLEQTWQFVDKPDTSAAVVVVDLENPQGREFYQQNAAQHQIIAFSTQAQENYRWFLQKPLKDAETLVALLRRITATLGTPVTPVKTNSEPRDTLVYPADTFARCLDDIIRAGKTTKVTMAGLPALYVEPAAQRYYILPLHAKAFCQTCRILCSGRTDALTTEVLSSEQLAHEVKDLQVYPLETLMWTAALCAAQRHPPESIDPKRPLHLREWPNFTRLSHQPEHVTLSAYFLGHQVSPETASQETRLALATVLAFCNACLAIGLVCYQDAPEVAPKAKKISGEMTNLFNRIMQCLTGKG